MDAAAPAPAAPDYRTEIRRAVLDAATFTGLTLSGPLRADATPWLRLRLRPVTLQHQGRVLQCAAFGAKKSETKNYVGDEATARLDELLALPYAHLHLQTTKGELHVRITRKGKVLMSRARPSAAPVAVAPGHDRVKQQPLPADRPDPLLQALGIMTPEGKVRASMQGKFMQVNEFLRIVEKTVAPLGKDRETPLELVDCGCGLAYLTFAAHHYLNTVLQVPAHLTGIDCNAEIIASCGQTRAALGAQGLTFQVADIAAFRPGAVPDAVLSLHACDTATDAAIAQAVRWDSRVILVAPCCQHELQQQPLALPGLEALLEHGILRTRFADLLTDAYRAAILQVLGYRTRLIEFVSPGHTAKNLLLRAEKQVQPCSPACVQQFLALKRLCGADFTLEKLLEDRLRERLV